MPRPKTNAPDEGISAEAIRVLRYIEVNSWGRGPRLPNTPERRLLKRKGIIYSMPPNHIAAARAIAGHGRVWYITERGRDLLEYLGRPDPGEQTYDPYPRPAHWK